jgi:hypothetical protein
MQPHLEPHVNDIIMLTARAMVADSYFATSEWRKPIETGCTPFLIADFDDESEYKALYSTVKSRALAQLHTIARIWPDVALRAASFLTEQAVRAATHFAPGFSYAACRVEFVFVLPLVLRWNGSSQKASVAAAAPGEMLSALSPQICAAAACLTAAGALSKGALSLAAAGSTPRDVKDAIVGQSHALLGQVLGISGQVAVVSHQLDALVHMSVLIPLLPVSGVSSDEQHYLPQLAARTERVYMRRPRILVAVTFHGTMVVVVIGLRRSDDGCGSWCTGVEHPNACRPSEAQRSCCGEVVSILSHSNPCELCVCDAGTFFLPYRWLFLSGRVLNSPRCDSVCLGCFKSGRPSGVAGNAARV